MQALRLYRPRYTVLSHTKFDLRTKNYESRLTIFEPPTFEFGDLFMTTEEIQNSPRTESEAQKVKGVDANYLAQYIETDNSLDGLKEHRTVPRFKLIQATTERELKENFGEGSVIVRPGDALICKFEAEPRSFEFVPLFFFVEWAKWRSLKGTGPMILERSHDASSNIAVRSKSVETRTQLYEGHETLEEKARLYYSYVEHLRFIGVIYGDHPLVGTPVTLSFERGEWRQGKNFISAVSMRRQRITVRNENGDATSESKQVPLWAQIWRLKTVHHAPDAERTWYGFHFEAPERSIILPAEAEAMKALHEEYKELFAKQRLMVIDEADTENTGTPGEVKAETEF